MGSAAVQTTINFFIEKSCDLEDELIDISQTRIMSARTLSNDMARINTKATRDKERIKNEMTAQGASSTEILAELKEIDEEADSQKDQLEQDEKVKETQWDLRTELANTQLEAIKADKESYETMREQDIKTEFGYFQD